MKSLKSILGLSLIAATMSQSSLFYTEPANKRLVTTKSQLTNKQQKARNKNKRAKKSK